MWVLPGVDYSRLDIVVQLYRKDITMTIRHEMLWSGEEIGLNISDMVRVLMTALVHTNGGSNLTSSKSIFQTQ